jgi:tetratricopeptide (TPR) repeat protein
MRLALVVGSSYEQNGKLSPLPSSELDGDLVERRLAERDANFKVVRFTAERGLAERIEQRLLAQTEPIEALLVYFSGYCALSLERGPALLLDGERLGTFSLSRLKNLFLQFAPAACLIVDAAAVVDARQALDAVAEAIGAVLTEGAPSIVALVAARNSDRPDSFGGSAFTGLFLMVLDWLGRGRELTQPVDIRWIFEGLRADEQLWSEIPAANLFGEQPFVLLPGSNTERALPSLRAEPLPSFDFDSSTADLDEMLGLKPRHPADEPVTMPGVTSFEEDDEVTPTFRRARGSEMPPSGAPLPSFELPSSTPSEFAPDSVPSFADDTNPTERPRGPDSASTSGVPSSKTQVTAPDALPSFGLASSADELVAAGREEDAAVEFEAALRLSEKGAERTGILARYARVLARLGRGTEAADHFAEASASDALHLDVLAVRAEWAEAAGDMENLLQTAEAWAGLAPAEARAFRFLAQAAEARDDWSRAIEAQRRLGRLAALTSAERVGALSKASRLAENNLGDRALAERLAEEALALSPAEPALRGRAESLLIADGRHQELFAHYERLLEAARAPAELTSICDQLEKTARDSLGDVALAAQALERALAKRPNDLVLHERLLDLHAAGAATSRALAHCRALTRLEPARAAIYRRAQALFEAEGSIDGAWQAANVLDCLGEADINESLFVSQHKPDGLLTVRSTLQNADWSAALYGPRHDATLTRVLEALGPAAIRVGIGLAKHKDRFFEPDAGTLQDPEKSTTMLAKTLVWTSRLLGLAPPALYVLPELSSGLDMVQSEQTGVLSARALGSGLGLGQLAFLWGRHLPRCRQEFRALPLFRSPRELSSLLTAALALGGAPEIDVRTVDSDTKRLYAALRREMRGPLLEGLRTVTRALSLDALVAGAESALENLELIGVRAGLLACGDVSLAAELIRTVPAEGLTRAEDQLAELYAFAVSAEYLALRQRLGVSLSG